MLNDPFKATELHNIAGSNRYLDVLTGTRSMSVSLGQGVGEHDEALVVIGGVDQDPSDLLDEHIQRVDVHANQHALVRQPFGIVGQRVDDVEQHVHVLGFVGYDVGRIDDEAIDCDGRAGRHVDRVEVLVIPHP